MMVGIRIDTQDSFRSIARRFFWGGGCIIMSDLTFLNSKDSQDEKRILENTLLMTNGMTNGE